MSAFRRMLIANRGEIAVRITHSCHAMGIEAVGVYSDFDRDAPHVRQADLAVPIGSAPARDSYLNIEAILSAARRTGADAIHPGYGFLAENAAFAAACEEAGLAFIGPRSSVIRTMGSKAEARKIAQEAGVPVAPAGTEKAFAAARGEAERAFADGTLLVEKYLESARHVEIQLFGDHHGNLIHLFERDCSIQRRHQKIIEESPSPAVTPQLRQRMAEAALALGRKIVYTNAGTVEFLLAPSGEFYFIEVNTRIQVEHPVTEIITGFDLIRMQIEIAQGTALPPQPHDSTGHAIEARLYAEDPANNFLPCTGTLHVWRPPHAITGLRVDSGVEEGTEIGVHYDPLLAKIVAHAADRETAINKLGFALRNLAAQGVTTNRDFLIDVLEHKDFRAGHAHTNFQLPPRAYDESEKAKDAICAAVVGAYIEHTEHAQRRILPSIPVRFHNNPYPRPALKLSIHGREVELRGTEPGVEILRVEAGLVEALVDNVRQRFQVWRHGDQYFVHS